MTSRRPYWCPKTMKRRPCWCPKPILWELISFLMQKLSFVPLNLHRYWPREWKRSIAYTTERKGQYIVFCYILILLSLPGTKYNFAGHSMHGKSLKNLEKLFKPEWNEWRHFFIKIVSMHKPYVSRFCLFFFSVWRSNWTSDWKGDAIHVCSVAWSSWREDQRHCFRHYSSSASGEVGGLSVWKL